MNVIGLDTTTRSFCLGLIRDEEVLERLIIEEEGYHSEQFLIYLSEMLEKQNMTKNDIDGYALSIGPGSLTGIRVGLAFLKGIGFATGKPVVPVNTLYAIAYELRESKEYVCPILVTRRNKVFTALYHFGSALMKNKSEEGKEKREDGGEKNEETIIEQSCIEIETFLVSLPRKEILFVGNGAKKYKNELLARCNGEASFAGEDIAHADPVLIAKIGFDKIKSGNIPPIDSLEPLYL